MKIYHKKAEYKHGYEQLSKTVTVYPFGNWDPSNTFSRLIRHINFAGLVFLIFYYWAPIIFCPLLTSIGNYMMGWSKSYDSGGFMSPHHFKYLAIAIGTWVYGIKILNIRVYQLVMFSFKATWLRLSLYFFTLLLEEVVSPRAALVYVIIIGIPFVTNFLLSTDVLPYGHYGGLHGFKYVPDDSPLLKKA